MQWWGSKNQFKNQCPDLVTLVYEPDVLPEVAVSLPTDWAGSPLLLMDVGEVPLQVSPQVAAVATCCTLVVLNLE